MSHGTWSKKDSRCTPPLNNEFAPKIHCLPRFGFWMYLYSIVISQIFGQICRGKLIFWPFLAFLGWIFMQSDFSLHTMVSFCNFWAIFWLVVGWGISMGQFWVFPLFAFLHFWRFWAVFGHFLGFSVHLGIWGLLVSCEVTRGTILIVGTVHDGFWGVWWVQGGSGGVWGGPDRVFFTPVWHFLPVWKSCMAPDLVPNTTLWSNWPMLTRLVSLTHFWPFGALLGAPKGPFYEHMKSFCYPKKSQNSVYGVQNAVYLSWPLI